MLLLMGPTTDLGFPPSTCGWWHGIIATQFILCVTTILYYSFRRFYHFFISRLLHLLLIITHFILIFVARYDVPHHYPSAARLVIAECTSLYSFHGSAYCFKCCFVLFLFVVMGSWFIALVYSSLLCRHWHDHRCCWYLWFNRSARAAAADDDDDDDWQQRHPFWMHFSSLSLSAIRTHTIFIIHLIPWFAHQSNWLTLIWRLINTIHLLIYLFIYHYPHPFIYYYLIIIILFITISILFCRWWSSLLLLIMMIWWMLVSTNVLLWVVSSI